MTIRFTHSHELTLWPLEKNNSELAFKDGMIKLSSDRFLLINGEGPRMLENITGARENCITMSVGLKI